MKVTEKEVSYVADLANLELTVEERESMVRDLNSILGHIEMLNELDTSKVEPMAQVLAAAPGVDLGYARRADALSPSLPHEDALANAPERNADFFKVPKVIER